MSEQKARSGRFKKTICLDFDGVINSYVSGWKGPTEMPDPAVPGSIEAILEYVSAGYRVAVFSSRSHEAGGVEALKAYLRREAGEHEDAIGAAIGSGDLFFPESKPPAEIYIDDRGYCFRGTFPTADEVRAFRPWNKA